MRHSLCFQSINHFFANERERPFQPTTATSTDDDDDWMSELHQCIRVRECAQMFRIRILYFPFASEVYESCVEGLCHCQSNNGNNNNGLNQNRTMINGHNTVHCSVLLTAFSLRPIQSGAAMALGIGHCRIGDAMMRWMMMTTISFVLYAKNRIEFCHQEQRKPVSEFECSNVYAVRKRLTVFFYWNFLSAHLRCLLLVKLSRTWKPQSTTAANTFQLSHFPDAHSLCCNRFINSLGCATRARARKCVKWRHEHIGPLFRWISTFGLGIWLIVTHTLLTHTRPLCYAKSARLQWFSLSIFVISPQVKCVIIFRLLTRFAVPMSFIARTQHFHASPVDTKDDTLCWQIEYM